jgi:ADP-heptose:LPS heptosyltransferase
MPLPAFVAALELLHTFVSTDTGPMHLAAVAGASIVMITQNGTPDYFLPLTDSLRIVDADTVLEVAVNDVYEAVAESLSAK